MSNLPPAPGGEQWPQQAPVGQPHVAGGYIPYSQYSHFQTQHASFGQRFGGLFIDGLLTQLLPMIIGYVIMFAGLGGLGVLDRLGERNGSGGLLGWLQCSVAGW